LRCVLDTNVLVSALLLPDSTPRQALDLTFQKGTILVSLEILVELYEVLSRKKFRRYTTEEDVRTFLAVITRTAEWIDVTEEINTCRDPKDNKFLEIAVCGRANYLISGDSDLLDLNPFRGVQIVAPHTFLESTPSPGAKNA
jgi:putative PIN family toxin of toxin-antitoxin system